jgi:hypothetical protein
VFAVAGRNAGIGFRVVHEIASPGTRRAIISFALPARKRRVFCANGIGTIGGDKLLE